MKQAYEIAFLILLGIALGTVSGWLLVNTIKHIDQEVSKTLNAK
jgi:NhaP-type Na+/H+ or K+/H+ antiporter